MSRTLAFADGRWVQMAAAVAHPVCWYNIYAMMLYDLVHRVDTFAGVPSAAIPDGTSGKAQAEAYMPAFHSALYWGLRQVARLEGGVSGLDFVDAGSGKGKMCFLAESFARRRRAGAWRSVTGIELNAALVDTARRNAARLRSAATFLADDITAQDGFRPGTVAFAFNPFGPDVMAALEARLRSVPGVYLIYNNPRHRGVFAGWTVAASTWDLAANLRTIVFRSPAARA